MTAELYKDLSCVSWILLNIPNKDFITENFHPQKIEQLTWEKAIEKSIKERTQFLKTVFKKNDFRKELLNKKTHPLIIAEINKDWTLILSNMFKDKEIAFQYCIQLCNNKNNVFNFYMDYHIGYDRWMIFKKNELRKICERNDNDELLIIGKLDKNEKAVLTKNGSYYDLTDIIELYAPFFKKLDYSDIKSKSVFYLSQKFSIMEKKVMNIERLKKEIKYLNPLMDSAKTKDMETRLTINDQAAFTNDELPF